MASARKHLATLARDFLAKSLDLTFVPTIQADEAVLRLIYSSYEFVKLGVQSFALSVLCILNQEYHQKGDDRSSSVDHQLPRVGVMEERSSRGPNDNEKTADNKRERSAGGPGDEVGQPSESLIHPELPSWPIA